MTGGETEKDISHCGIGVDVNHRATPDRTFLSELVVPSARGHERVHHVDLQKLGIESNGILAQAIGGFPAGLNTNLFNGFNAVLQLVVTSEQERVVLSSLPEKLSSTNFQAFLHAVKNIIPEEWRTKLRSLKNFAKALSFCTSPLSDGKFIRDEQREFFKRLDHQAGENCFEFVTRNTTNGVESIGIRVVNLDNLGIKPGGALYEALSGAPESVHNADFYRFMYILSRVAENETGRELLSKSSALQDGGDVHRLFSLVDSVLPNIKSRGAYFTSFRKFMRFSLAHLKSGQSFSDAAYNYRRRADSDIQSELESNRRNSDENPLEFLKMISASSDDDAYEKAAAQLRAHIDTHLIACEQILSEQEECVEKMNAIHAAGPPRTVSNALLNGYENGNVPTYHTMQRLPQDVLNWFLISFVHNERMFETGSSKNRGFGLSDFFLSYGLQRSAGYAFDVALSQFYLTHRSMVACLMILAFKTNWNGSTLASLTPLRVRKTGSGYRLTGLKPKTDQVQQEEVTWRTEDKLACRALELLIWHNKNVDLFAERRTTSIFCPLRLRYDGHRIAYLPRFNEKMKLFLNRNNLSKITLRDYRTIKLNYIYVAGGGDIVATQVRAGHASLSTTARYIRFKIQQELHEANIRRYMKNLAKSIRWVTGATELDDSKQSKAVKRLLFPASPYSAENRDSAVDVWLASSGEMRLDITEGAAIHCCYQQRFYEKNLGFLISFNESRFLEFHLPRIAFCAALYGLLKKSPFSSLVRKEIA